MTSPTQSRRGLILGFLLGGAGIYLGPLGDRFSPELLTQAIHLLDSLLGLFGASFPEGATIFVDMAIFMVVTTLPPILGYLAGKAKNI